MTELTIWNIIVLSSSLCLSAKEHLRSYAVCLILSKILEEHSSTSSSLVRSAWKISSSFGSGTQILHTRKHLHSTEGLHCAEDNFCQSAPQSGELQWAQVSHLVISWDVIWLDLRMSSVTFPSFIKGILNFHLLVISHGYLGGYRCGMQPESKIATAGEEY